MPGAAFAPGETFAAAKAMPPLFSALVSVAIDTSVSPGLESAWAFASRFAVGQTSVSPELASLMFFAAVKTPLSLELESPLFVAAAVATGETPLSAQLAASGLVLASATTTLNGCISFG